MSLSPISLSFLLSSDSLGSHLGVRRGLYRDRLMYENGESNNLRCEPIFLWANFLQMLNEFADLSLLQ
jgi:hypothetical protein